MYDKVYYCFCGNDCKFETMTKEQIIAAIAEATGHTPTNIDDAFITKVKEQNKGGAVKFWVGTTAEYNAIVAAGEKEEDVIYIKTDDKTLENVNKKIEKLEEETEEQIKSLSDEVLKTGVYKEGDNFETTLAPVFGYAAGNNKQLVLFLPLSKIVTSNYVFVPKLFPLLVGVKGLVNGGRFSATEGDYLVETTVIKNGLQFIITHTTGTFSNVENLTPVTGLVDILVNF